MMSWDESQDSAAKGTQECNEHHHGLRSDIESGINFAGIVSFGGKFARMFSQHGWRREFEGY